MRKNDPNLRLDLHDAGASDPILIFFISSQAAKIGIAISTCQQKARRQIGIRPPSHGDINRV